jgi:hypothetical protein
MKTVKKIVNLGLVSLFLATLTLISSGSHASAWSWSGGLRIWDKTTGSSLSTSSSSAQGSVGTNVVFSPEGLGPNAHHFTVMMEDMNTGQTVFYQTMKTKWSIDNPTLDGTLGWTTYKTGSYWLQVNAYQADGIGAGAYYAVLKVK